MSAMVSLQARGDVVYARIPEEFSGGISRAVDQVRQQLPGMAVDWVALREAFLYGRGRNFPVANRHAEAVRDEKAKVRFSADRLTAYLILYPPKPRGQLLEEADILDLVKAYGVPSHLIDNQALRLAHVRRSYHEAEPFARGRPGVDGTPARVEWREGMPSDPEGFLQAVARREEYPEVILAEVQAGRAVGVRRESTAGTPGLAVDGKPLPARPGGDPVRLGCGLFVEGDRVVAVRAGHLQLTGADRAEAAVIPLFKVRSVQDLKPWEGRVLPGSVIVDGDLEVSFPLRVLGDLEVRGSVVRSALDVMGSLFVRDGVMHQRGEPIRVGGVVSASFLERAWVLAHTIHVRRHSLKSRLIALDRIQADEHSSIHGGQVHAGSRITGGTLGSQNGIVTEVFAGNGESATTLQAVFEEWARVLETSGPTAEQSLHPLSAQVAERWDEIAKEIEPIDPAAAAISAHEIHPGVTVRLGPAIRKIESPVGPVCLTYERIGSRGRVAMTRE